MSSGADAETSHHPPSATGTDLGYLPALDGIRAVAVIAIMGYHGGLFLTSGGFYSLDTFFALSGFLITTLLVAEWQRSGSIRLGAFWARRARRLLPALFLMVLVVVGYVALFAPPDTYPGLRGDAIASLFYVANWHFIVVGSNYFVQTGATSPLQHTWSLAVEEQFYLLWPLIVLGILRTRLGLRFLLATCIVGSIASAAVMAILYSPAAQNRIYYGTDTRAQSLLIGAALSVALTCLANRRAGEQTGPVTSTLPGWRARTRSMTTVMTGVGCVGIAASAALWTLVTVNDAFAFRGGFLLAALSTSCVLASVVVAPRSLIATALSLRPLRYIGRISYGLYLWHFPLFIWIDHGRTGLEGAALFGLRFAVTVVVASISYFAVEQPIRQRRFLKTWTAWIVTPVSIVGATAAVFAATIVPVTAAPTAFRPPATQTGSVYSGPTVKLLVVGDSTAATLAIGLSAYEHAYNIKIYDDGILGCGVTDGAEFQLQGVDAPMDPRCTGSTTTQQWPQIWKSDVEKVRPNVVMILVGRWEVVNRTYHGRWTNILQPAYASYVERQLRSAVRIAGSQGSKVMLLTAPCYDTGEQPDGQPWPEDSSRRLAVYNAIVRRVGATSPDTTVVNFNALACPSGHYQTDIDGVDARYDGVHFTLGGGAVFEPDLIPIAEQLGREQMAASET